MRGKSMNENDKIGIVISYDSQSYIKRDLLFMAGLEMKEYYLKNYPAYLDVVIAEINESTDNIGFISLILSKELLLLVRQTEFKDKFKVLVETIKHYQYSIFVGEHIIEDMSLGSEIAAHKYDDLLKELFYYEFINNDTAYYAVIEPYKNELQMIEEKLYTHFFLDVIVPILFICDELTLYAVLKNYNCLESAINELFSIIDKEDDSYRKAILDSAKQKK